MAYLVKLKPGRSTASSQCAASRTNHPLPLPAPPLLVALNLELWKQLQQVTRAVLHLSLAGFPPYNLVASPNELPERIRRDVIERRRVARV